METRYREGASIGTLLRVEGWSTRFTRRVMQAEAVMTLETGAVIAEASGTYLPVPRHMLARMVDSWPGFAEFVGDDG
jgi:hypothetical protein